MSTRHYAADFPTGTSRYLGDLRTNGLRRRPVIVVGELSDAAATRLVRNIQAKSSGLHLAAYVPVWGDAGTGASHAALTELATHVTIGTLADNLKMRIVVTWKRGTPPIDADIRALVNMVADQSARPVLPILKLGEMLKEPRQTPTHRPTGALLERAKAAFEAQSSTSLPRLVPEMNTGTTDRGERAARGAVGRLLSRGASQNVIGEHLRAYGYLADTKLGVWPIESVRRIIAEVEEAGR